MHERIEKLIALYAKYDVAKIEADQSLLENTFGKPLQQLAQESGFSRDQEFVASLKRDIEFLSLVGKDVKDQIAEFLKMLLTHPAMFEEPKIKTKKMETLRDLFIKEFYAPRCWSKPQKKHFDFAFYMLREWNRYFLSYTNDTPRAINDEYKRVIQAYTEKKTRKKRNWDEDNILADAIHNRLQSHNLVGSFFDKKDIKVGDTLDDKITPACEKTLAFVQLVQRETFSKVKGNDNWCFKEYQIFLQCNTRELADNKVYQDLFRKRFNALLAGKDEQDIHPPLSLPPDYQAYKRRIFQEQRFKALPRDPKSFDAAIGEVADEIFNLQCQIIENVPS